MLRGFRLHRCPYWIRPSIMVSDHNGVLFSTKKHPRTKDLSPEDFWFSAPKKGIMVFALPGEPGLTELAGDFKIHFHDRQGDFYCWLNTTMIENRKILNTSDLDGFDKRKLPSPGFQVEVVLVDYNGTVPASPQTETSNDKSVESSVTTPIPVDGNSGTTNSNKDSESNDKDDVFSDSEAEESSSKTRQSKATSEAGGTDNTKSPTSETTNATQIAGLTHETQQISLGKTSSTTEPRNVAIGETASGLEVPTPVGEVSDFKAMAADASVFTFGDDEDYDDE